MAARSEAGLLSVVACLFLLANYGWNVAGDCVPCGIDVSNTLSDCNSGSQHPHYTVVVTSAPNLVGVTLQCQNVTHSISLSLTIMNTNGTHVGMGVYCCIAMFERGRTNETTRAVGPAVPNRAYEDHVLGHNGKRPVTTAAVQEEGAELPSQPVFPTCGHNKQEEGPVTTAAVQEEGAELPSQPVFPTCGHNIQGEEPVTTAPIEEAGNRPPSQPVLPTRRRVPIGHGIPATNTAQQVTISAPVAETGAGKTTQPVYGVPTNHSSGSNRQTEETGGGFPSQAVFPTWRRVPPCHGLLVANREHQVNCSAPVAESGTGKTAQLVFKQLSA